MYSSPYPIVRGMAKDKGTSTLSQEKDKRVVGHQRVIEAMFLVLLL